MLGQAATVERAHIVFNPRFLHCAKLMAVPARPVGAAAGRSGPSRRAGLGRRRRLGRSVRRVGGGAGALSVVGQREPVLFSACLSTALQQRSP